MQPMPPFYLVIALCCLSLLVFVCPSLITFVLLVPPCIIGIVYFDIVRLEPAAGGGAPAGVHELDP